MDNRAYHLQPQAHTAVATALQNGKLTRGPCEVCGERGQAHHDSYYPERWLDVRWLCPSHHRQWHVENEPEWPDIFDHHPSDAPNRGHGGVRKRKGMHPRPWWHRGRKLWYVTIEGRQHNLGGQLAAAEARYKELLVGYYAGQQARHGAAPHPAP